MHVQRTTEASAARTARPRTSAARAWSGTLALAAAMALVGGAATTAGAAPAAAPAKTPSAADVAAVKAALQKTLDAGAPGAFAVIRDHGQRLGTTSVALGKADLDGTPMSPALRFRAGSNSKMFASVLVMRLVEQGRVDLDKPLRTYLPAGTLPDGWDMTVRQVMQHRGGVYDHTNDLLEQAGEETTAAFEARIRNNAYQPGDMVAMSVKHGQQYVPGTKYSYSNTGYVLLGMAVEHLTGRKYADVLDREIIRPLGLRNTSFVVPKKAIDGRHATGYLTNDDRTKPLLDSTEQTASWVWTAGAVITTAADLDRFLTAVTTGSHGGLVSDASLAQMTSVLPTPTAKISYGLGIREIALSCAKVYGHGGIVQGYQTQSFVTADGKKSVVAFANASNNGAVTTALVNVLEPAFCGAAPAASPAKQRSATKGGAVTDRTVPVVEDTRI
ncbi:serine hydrolase domain-containing protein [Streptomyces sp. NPDC001941]|uniref:serine hydrolase domain-containing protein n=1 Tax=Streptomyces sp. NPDC001941 TaxID=3154659 RepID=UPI00331BFB22